MLSVESTTQGDPLEMPLYALATIPLLQHLRSGVEHKFSMQMMLVHVESYILV